MNRLAANLFYRYLKEGIIASIPISFGIVPIGVSLGVLAQKAGLEAWQVALMSLLVFAGGSQFIAVAMLAVNASISAIVTTTFIVNLRHLLMSSAIAAYMPQVSHRFIVLFSYGITDEAFAVNMARFKQGEWHRYSALAVNMFFNAAWVSSTVAGAYLGQFVPTGAAGIDYAMTAMFICLVMFQLRSAVFVATAFIALICSVVTYLWLPGNLYIIISSIFAATAGFALKRFIRSRKVCI